MPAHALTLPQVLRIKFVTYSFLKQHSHNSIFYPSRRFGILVTDALSTSQRGISGLQQLEREAKRQWLK